MGHPPIKHLERAERIAKVALQMYQAGKLSHNQAAARFETALGHVDVCNAEMTKVIKAAARSSDRDFYMGNRPPFGV